MGKKFALPLLFAASLLLASCEQRQASSVPTVVEPTQPATVQQLPTVQDFTEVGPESTPPAFVGYPTSLSIGEIQSQLGGGGSLPEGFAENPEVSALVNTRLTWFRLAGLNVDDSTRTDYVTPSIITWGQEDSFRWDVVPKDTSGQIVGWLQIHDENLESTWRFAETPSWDPNFDPTADQYRFDLPEKLFPENLFEVILVGGEFKVLVEVDSQGKPLRWLNALQQEMRLVAGVDLPQQFRLSENGVAEELVDGQWQEVVLPEIPESLQPTMMVGENGLLQVKVQLTDYEVPPDGLVISEYSNGRWHPVPFAFTRSLEDTREILKMDYRYFGAGEVYGMNPNGIDTASYPGPFQGMRLEVDEVSEETRITMLQINLRDMRVLKFEPTSMGATGSPLNPLNLTVMDIARLIVAAEEHEPLVNPEDPLRRVYFGATFYIVTERATEYSVADSGPGQRLLTFALRCLATRKGQLKP